MNNTSGGESGFAVAKTVGGSGRIEFMQRKSPQKIKKIDLMQFEAFNTKPAEK